MEIKNYWANILVEGSDSADSIYNYYGGDNVTINTKEGNDYIYNVASPATIIAGDGDDTYFAPEGGFSDLYTVYLGEGNDSLYVDGATSKGSMFGGNGNDTIESHNVWYQVIDSDDGDDLIVNERGAWQSVFSSNGNDTIRLLTDVKCTVNSGNGDDFIDIRDSKNSVNSGNGNDTITVSRQDIKLQNINDVTIVGGKDNDLIEIKLDDEQEDNRSKILITYNNGDGNDTIIGLNSRVSLDITADYSKEIIGNDIMFNVGEGSVLLKDAVSENEIKIVDRQANISDNSYYRVKIVDSLIVTVNAEKRNSGIYLEANDNNNVIRGGQGNDTIFGMNGKDRIDGKNGDDIIYGNVGRDKIFGSYGNDTLFGGTGKDTLYGNDGNDIIYGEQDKDYINGGNGNDWLDGGVNNDTVIGGKGNDTVYGGNGNDMLYGNTGNDSINGSSGNDTIWGNEGDDIISGSNGQDTIYGGDGNDSINGGKDNDIISGNAGKDSINGSYGDDVIYGGNDNDTLKGSYGNDTLWGGAGTDKLFGGEGKDVFVYVQDTGKDYIYDWESHNDMLQILREDGSAGTFTRSSFKDGNLTLAIEDGGHVIFKNVTSDSQFNINGTVHSIVNKKLR